MKKQKTVIVKGNAFLGGNHVIVRIKDTLFAGTLYGLTSKKAVIRSSSFLEDMNCDFVLEENLTNILSLKDNQCVILNNKDSEFKKLTSTIREVQSNYFYDKTPKGYPLSILPRI